MDDINTVTLTGNLTRDPKTGIGKVKYAFYSIAVNKTINGMQKTKYFDIAAFNEHADFAEKNLNKGKRVMVTGELDIRNDKPVIIVYEQVVNQNTNDIKSTDNIQKPFVHVKNDGSFLPVIPDEEPQPF